MKYRPTQCKEIVKKILTEYAETRDSDEKLLARLWLSECVIQKINFEKSLEHLYNGLLTSPASIIRVRRLLQNDNLELRGSKYNLRQQKLEKDAKEDIINYGK